MFWVKFDAWLSDIRIRTPGLRHSVAPSRNAPTSAVPTVIEVVATTGRPQTVGLASEDGSRVNRNTPEVASRDSSIPSQSVGCMTTPLGGYPAIWVLVIALRSA